MTLPAAQPIVPAPMGKGTLSRRLVLRMTALVAAVTVVLTGFIALSSFQILQQQLDSKLEAAASRPGRVAVGSTGQNSQAGNDDQTPQSDPSGSDLIRIDYNPLTGVASITSKPDGLTNGAATALWATTATADPVNVQVAGLGLYRMLIRETTHGRVLVALPYNEVANPLAAELIMAGLLTLGAIVVAYLGARRVVETSLRPLNRLAATANQVSHLPLASGEGQVPIRVAPADADPASEVGQVGLAFNHMLDNVENAFAARHRSETKVRRFVADASHELRNPLASIRGYAELTRRGNDELPEDAAHALGRIEAESERMSALVQDLLLLARLDSEPTLELQPTDVTEMVINAVSDARAASRDHDWSLRLPDEPVMARADPHKLHQVVVNLLANARTHTPPGTKVEAALHAEGPWAVITVTDNGPGVPAEIQDVVFERFTRADASRVRQAGGSSTGLGLAIVSAVVGAHGGQVALDSHPGYTRFTVRVPLA